MSGSPSALWGSSPRLPEYDVEPSDPFTYLSVVGSTMLVMTGMVALSEIALSAKNPRRLEEEASAASFARALRETCRYRVV